MMPTSQEEWLLRISLISGTLALSFNVLLGYIILTTKCIYIGRYKWLLFLYTCSSTLYGTTQILSAGEFLLVEDGYMFYDSHGLLPVWAGELVLATFVSLYVANIVILTLSFIYRYLAVCNYEGLEFFIGHWIAIGLASIIIVLFEMFLITYTLMPSTVTHEFFEKPFYNATGLHITEVAYMGAPFFLSGMVNPEVIIMVAMFLLLGIIGGYLMITLSVKIWKGLRNHTGESATLAQNQRRIFALLVFQLSLPLLFQVVPLQIVMGSTYLHLPSEGIVKYFGCILSIAQVIDPLLTFYFIRPYRLALFIKLCGGGADVVGSSHTATIPGIAPSYVNK